MNWGLIGHEWAVQHLKDHLRNGALRHAYLFTGPQGVGRRTLALRLAQALNCPKGSDEPCGRCRTCSQIERMQYADLAVVEAEARGGTLKVDQVRELQYSLSLAPYEGRFRVALLLRFEEAHPSAANALLKTLEEPPERVKLLLTAQNTDGLLPTIVSRCEVLRLRPLPLEQVSRALQERFQLEQTEALLLAHLSGGRPGYAIRLYQEKQLLARRTEWLDEHTRLLAASRLERFAFADLAAKDKGTLLDMLPFWQSVWRDVMLRAAGSAAPLANLDREDQVNTLADKLGVTSAYRMTTLLERTLLLLSQNANARLAMEVVMLNLPRITIN
jgi:DNA polymerase-3 subunit delta'